MNQNQTETKSLESETDSLKLAENKVTVIHKIGFKDCEIWFVRFSLDKYQRVLALGNQVGRTYVWDLDVAEPTMNFEDKKAANMEDTAMDLTNEENLGTVKATIGGTIGENTRHRRGRNSTARVRHRHTQRHHSIAIARVMQGDQ